MKLTNPTEKDLNTALAFYVARMTLPVVLGGKWVDNDTYQWIDLPSFTENIALVLPHLEKWRDRPYLYRMAQIDMAATGWLVKLHDTNKPDLIAKAEDTSLARAIVLALLPHYGVEVEFTKGKISGCEPIGDYEK